MRFNELNLMRMSLALSVVYACVSLPIAVLCDSMTVLLDALYCVADVIISLFAIYTVRRLGEPPNERYHFGYAKYEPVQTTLNGVLITALCVAAIIGSIQDIVHHDPVARLSLAIWYAGIGMFVCTGFGAFMRIMGKRLNSDILAANGVLWIIDGLLDLCVFVAFVAIASLKGVVDERFLNYVDPVMCIALSCVLMRKPLLILRDGFLDIVDASPGEDMRLRIDELLSGYLARHRIGATRHIRIRKAGRKLYVVIGLAAAGHRPLREITAIRREIEQGIAASLSGAEVSVAFEEQTRRS